MTTDTMPEQSTRARLLAAARAEFAAHGVAGARVDRIAAAAGANKERIYGYFGSKHNLFQAVIIEAKAEHAAALGQPAGDLAEYVGQLYDYHREHPTLLRLLQWEALAYGAQPPAHDTDRAGQYHDKVTALDTALPEHDTHEPAALLHTLIGLAAWPHTMPQLRRYLLHPDSNEPDHNTIRRHIVDTARQLLYPAQ